MVVTKKEHAMYRPQKYVGVAGITTRAESDAVVGSIPADFPRQVALGVLASAKTLTGGTLNKRSPSREIISGIFSTDQRALNLLHYFSRTTGVGLANELREAMYFGGRLCHGLQLNITWPDPDELLEFVVSLNRDVPPRIVLQIGPAALTAIGFDALALVSKIGDYSRSGEVISDVLIDVSGGLGIGIDEGSVGKMVEAVAASFPDLGIGIAGGFRSSNLPSKALLSSVSIDAESGLRSSDQLDLRKVHRYLARCDAALAEKGT